MISMQITDRANVSFVKKCNVKHPLISWQLVEIYNSLKWLKTFEQYCVCVCVYIYIFFLNRSLLMMMKYKEFSQSYLIFLLDNNIHVKDGLTKKRHIIIYK